MSLKHTLVAGAAALAALGAHAQSNFGFQAFAQDLGNGASQAIDTASLPAGQLGTGGLITAQAGGTTAFVSAVADPAAGMFKSYSRVVIEPHAQRGFGVAESYFAFSDMLVFNGPEATVDVSFQLNWDTRVAGQAAAAAEKNTGYPDTPAQYFSSTQTLHFGAAPAGIPSEDPCRGEPACDMGGGLPPPTPPTHEVWGWAFAGDAFTDTVFYGAGDGAVTGGTTLRFTVATGKAIPLSFAVSNSAVCAWMTKCDLTVDASHSDYIGMTVSPGAGFTSANGYRYAGLAGAVAAVPEPGTWVMALLGLAALGMRARRKPA